MFVTAMSNVVLVDVVVDPELSPVEVLRLHVEVVDVGHHSCLHGRATAVVVNREEIPIVMDRKLSFDMTQWKPRFVELSANCRQKTDELRFENWPDLVELEQCPGTADVERLVARRGQDRAGAQVVLAPLDEIDQATGAIVIQEVIELEIRRRTRRAGWLTHDAIVTQVAHERLMRTVQNSTRDFFYLGVNHTTGFGASLTSDPSSAPATETDPRKRASIMAERLPHFTERGFDVVATPPAVHQRLRAAYIVGLANTRPEKSDPNYLTAGDPDYIDIGGLADDTGRELHHIHQDWAKVDLELVAAYGLRIYRRGQVLRWHADRAETHVISSIVHIDSASDRPWPLHIEDHCGVEHEICLEPGQMLLYESATCAHARPTPFEGNHYGSLFVHFKPVVDWDYTTADITAILEIESP